MARALLTLWVTSAALAQTGCIDWSSLSEHGCSDGDREGLKSFPDLAACEGAWDGDGVVGPPAPTCDRQGGNTGVHWDGLGCSASDLCASGWHVCFDARDVEARDGFAACAELSGIEGALFVTAQRGSGPIATCPPGSPTDASDVFGCGALGTMLMTDACAPLDRVLRSGECPEPWTCGGAENYEGALVVKGPAPGGVLCCRD